MWINRMSIVTEYLEQLIAKQVDDRGIVIWYDPEHAYGTCLLYTSRCV